MPADSLYLKILRFSSEELFFTHEENNNYKQHKPVLRRSNAWTEEDIARIEKQLNKKLRNEKREESYSFEFD